MMNRILTAYVAFISALMIFPIAIVIAASINSAAYLSFPPAGFSIIWYKEVLTDPTWSGSLWLTLKIGIAVSLLSTALGVAAALGLRVVNSAWSGALQTFFLSPLMLPTVLIGLSLMQLYQSLGIRASVLTVTLGQLLIACPYVIRLVLASFNGIDPRLERAASILGANPIRVFWHVTFPLIRHGVLAGLLFSFIVSLDDVNIALFLSDVHTTPLPVQLFSYIEQNADSLGAAAASLLVLLACGAVFICDRLVGIEWLFGAKQRSA
ncbi:Inner membrane ABC transporter permease protein YdcV [Afipia felis]|uniref:Inner membrane ABC transporter permease protein YdcV n=2 Tax=Nitrobacteraceae TaxID=41294 RepID=A0A090MS44_AFIFE|nr:binding-protein-dependent transport systems inner membrane component [Afipia sp. 1NLS2]MBE0701566.1 ABC transporter permease [Afipia sp.]CEG09037.1 Inner membrane ABC transporter permease protein YdcV [Afipia felis]